MAQIFQTNMILASPLIRYTFWGYTESQLKEGNVIFFEEDAVWTVASLKAALGDLESVYLEHGYGKYCARLGLSFSSTVEAFEVSYAYFTVTRNPC